MAAQRPGGDLYGQLLTAFGATERADKAVAAFKSTEHPGRDADMKDALAIARTAHEQAASLCRALSEILH
jgi:hypothetical protein